MLLVGLYPMKFWSGCDGPPFMIVPLEAHGPSNQTGYAIHAFLLPEEDFRCCSIRMPFESARAGEGVAVSGRRFAVRTGL